MIFNDYVEILNNQLQVIRRLDSIIRELESILCLKNEWERKMFSYSFNKLISSTYNTNGQANANELIDVTCTYHKELREKLISIDFMEFGEILSEFKNEGGEILSEESDFLTNEFKSSYKIIHEYKKFTDSNDITDYYTKCINAINSIVKISKNLNTMY